MKLIFQDTLPADLRSALEAEASELDITMNDLAGRILAERYGMLWEDTGRKFHSVVEPFRLRAPDELALKIRLDAVSRGGTIRGVVLDTLMKNYKLGHVDPRRRPRAHVH